jgi:hypothetical protein
LTPNVGREKKVTIVDGEEEEEVDGEKKAKN